MQKERFFSHYSLGVQERQEKINRARQEVAAGLNDLAPPRRYSGDGKRVIEALRKRLKLMAKNGQFPPLNLKEEENEV